MEGYLDITLPIKTGQMQYPGDAECKISSVSRIKDKDEFNVTRLDMSAHTGTHMDAPYHCFNEGQKIHELGAHHFIGKAKVFDFSDAAGCIEAKDLEKKPIEKGDIVLLKTANSRRVTDDVFIKDYVYLSGAAAEYLAKKEIVTLGFDYLSVDAFDDTDYPAHRALLGNGIVIIEGLVLGDIEEGIYDIAALPMKILNGDGAPARVMIRKRKI